MWPFSIFSKRKKAKQKKILFLELISQKKAILAELISENNILSENYNTLIEKWDVLNYEYINRKQNAILNIPDKKFRQAKLCIFNKGDSINYVTSLFGQPIQIELGEMGHRFYHYKIESIDSSNDDITVFEFDSYGILCKDIALKPGYRLKTVYEIYEYQKLNEMKTIIKENYASLEFKQKLIKLCSDEIKELLKEKLTY